MGTTINEYPEGIEDNPKASKCCKNCRHFCPYVYEFDSDDDSDYMASDYGECRRFPPASADPHDTGCSGFPIVSENAWCGEFDF